MRPHYLPAFANWICALSLPLWSSELKKLVDPNLPHDPIGLVHLTSIRKTTIKTTDDKAIDVLLTYSGIEQLRQIQASPSALSDRNQSTADAAALTLAGFVR